MAKSLEAGKLIVGAIAVSIDPTGTAATALGIDAILTIKDWFSATSSLSKLTKEIDKKFQIELATRRYDKPENARTLLPQMLSAAFPTGENIAACGLDAQAILVEMHKILASKDSEYRLVENATAFDNLVLPLLKTACDDPDLVTILTPHLTRVQMADQKEAKADIKDVKSMMEGFLSGATIPLADMQKLAAQFGAHDITDKATLENFLNLKADEYRALKSEVDYIDEGLKRLSNLKAAAQGAIGRVDLDEVELLLSRVQEVELEEAAKTAELRANNALLRGKVEQAYKLLSAAADSFAAVSTEEQIGRALYKYPKILFNHALRYGGTGFKYCQTLIEGIGRTVDLTQNENWQADHFVWLAIALQEQGIRTDGAKGAALHAQTVTAYQNALRIRTETEHPVQWAMTQNNLASALQEQGIRTDGAEGTALLAQAVTAYQCALRIRTETEHPVDWAMTQENIAIAERAIAHHNSTLNPRPHLDAALGHVDNALSKYDPTHMPYNHEKATKLREAILTEIEAL